MTALESPADIVRGLFIDSLLFLPLLPSRPIRLVDIGAGSGIPGLPLKLVESRIELTLIESKRKRVSFLLAACRELEIPEVRVLEGRAEVLADQQPELEGGFDVAVARAVGGEAFIGSLARRYVRPGGTIAIAGSPSATPAAPFEAVRVPIPGARATRVFLKMTKESTVPRET